MPAVACTPRPPGSAQLKPFSVQPSSSSCAAVPARLHVLNRAGYTTDMLVSHPGSAAEGPALLGWSRSAAGPTLLASPRPRTAIIIFHRGGPAGLNDGERRALHVFEKSCTRRARHKGMSSYHLLIGTVAFYRRGKLDEAEEHEFCQPAAPRCGRRTVLTRRRLPWLRVGSRSQALPNGAVSAHDMAGTVPLWCTRVRPVAVRHRSEVTLYHP